MKLSIGWDLPFKFKRFATADISVIKKRKHEYVIMTSVRLKH